MTVRIPCQLQLAFLANRRLLLPIVWLLADAIVIIRNMMEMAKNEQPRIVPDIRIF